MLLKESGGQQDFRGLFCLSKLAIFSFYLQGKPRIQQLGSNEKTEDRHLGLLSINLYIHLCTFCYLLLLPYWSHGRPVPEVTWGVANALTRSPVTLHQNLKAIYVSNQSKPMWLLHRRRRSAKQVWGEHAKSTSGEGPGVVPQST